METKKMTNIRLLDKDNKIVDYWNVDESIDLNELKAGIFKAYQALDRVLGQERDFHIETQEITVWA